MLPHTETDTEPPRPPGAGGRDEAPEERALNVDLPVECHDAIEHTLARLTLKGVKLRKKQMLAELIREYLPRYEADRLERVGDADRET